MTSIFLPPHLRDIACDASLGARTSLNRLSVAQRHWAVAMESIGDVVWIAEADGGSRPLSVVYASARLVEWLRPGPSSGGMQDQPADGDDSPDGSAGDEFAVPDPSGSARWLRERRLRLEGDSTAAERVGAVLEDVTGRRRAQEELAQALDVQRRARLEAERLSASKDEFISVVSHDLRSPLNAIRGWAHVLKLSSNLTSAQERALDAIDRNITAQARMVDDLLDSQRILRGKLVLSFGQPALADLIDEAVETIRAAAESKRIVIDVIHDREVGVIDADIDRLRQSMANLLSNSLKFTPEDGRITVTSSRSMAASGRGEQVRISVTDTGMGLTPEQLEHVFDPVTKANEPSGRRQGGLNLPLSLARQLVEMHGGSVSALSDGVDFGLTMTIELPVRQPSSAAAM